MNLVVGVRLQIFEEEKVCVAMNERSCARNPGGRRAVPKFGKSEKRINFNSFLVYFFSWCKHFIWCFVSKFEREIRRNNASWTWKRFITRRVFRLKIFSRITICFNSINLHNFCKIILALKAVKLPERFW